jgi:hypothetical protein
VHFALGNTVGKNAVIDGEDFGKIATWKMQYDTYLEKQMK